MAKAESVCRCASDAQRSEPLAGTWIANLEKSRRHPGNPFRSAIIEIDPERSLVAMQRGPRVLETVASKGKEVVGRGRYEVSADGASLSISDSDAAQLIVLDRAS